MNSKCIVSWRKMFVSCMTYDMIYKTSTVTDDVNHTWCLTVDGNNYE